MILANARLPHGGLAHDVIADVEIASGVIAALHAPVFYATHFGRCEGTDVQLQELRSRLRSWEQFVLAALRRGDEAEAIAAELRRTGREEVLSGADEETVRRYEVASAYQMNVSGYERYLRKRYQLPPPGSA